MCGTKGVVYLATCKWCGSAEIPGPGEEKQSAVVGEIIIPAVEARMDTSAVGGERIIPAVDARMDTSVGTKNIACEKNNRACHGQSDYTDGGGRRNY